MTARSTTSLVHRRVDASGATMTAIPVAQGRLDDPAHEAAAVIGRLPAPVMQGQDERMWRVLPDWVSRYRRSVCRHRGSRRPHGGHASTGRPLASSGKARATAKSTPMACMRSSRAVTVLLRIDADVALFIQPRSAINLNSTRRVRSRSRIEGGRCRRRGGCRARCVQRRGQAPPSLRCRRRREA